MNLPTPQPRTAAQQRVAEVPHVEVVHAAAAGQLVLTVHVTVPDGYVVPTDLKADVASAIGALCFNATTGDHRNG